MTGVRPAWFSVLLSFPPGLLCCVTCVECSTPKEHSGSFYDGRSTALVTALTVTHFGFLYIYVFNACETVSFRKEKRRKEKIWTKILWCLRMAVSWQEKSNRWACLEAPPERDSIDIQVHRWVRYTLLFPLLSILVEKALFSYFPEKRVCIHEFICTIHTRYFPTP